MHPHSNLSQAQREQAVELFEHCYGASAVANRLGVKRGQVRRLKGRFRLHGRLCLVSKPTRKHTKIHPLPRHKAAETKADLAEEFALSSPHLISHWV